MDRTIHTPGMGQKTIQARTPKEICRSFELSDQAVDLAADGQNPAAFIQLLLDHQLYRDAFRFIGHLLSRRQAIWWGCLCVWEVLGAGLTESEQAALRAAAQWALEPSEPHRRAAEERGKAAGANSPAGSMALAAFFCEGSLSRPDLPAVPPPPALAINTLARVLLQAARRDRAHLHDHCRRFVNLASEVMQYQHLR